MLIAPTAENAPFVAAWGTRLQWLQFPDACVNVRSSWCALAPTPVANSGYGASTSLGLTTARVTALRHSFPGRVLHSVPDPSPLVSFGSSAPSHPCCPINIIYHRCRGPQCYQLPSFTGWLSVLLPHLNHFTSLRTYLLSLSSRGAQQGLDSHDEMPLHVHLPQLHFKILPLQPEPESHAATRAAATFCACVGKAEELFGPCLPPQPELYPAPLPKQIPCLWGVISFWGVLESVRNTRDNLFSWLFRWQAAHSFHTHL